MLNIVQAGTRLPLPKVTPARVVPLGFHGAALARSPAIRVPHRYSRYDATDQLKWGESTVRQSHAGHTYPAFLLMLCEHHVSAHAPEVGKTTATLFAGQANCPLACLLNRLT